MHLMKKSKETAHPERNILIIFLLLFVGFSYLTVRFYTSTKVSSNPSPVETPSPTYTIKVAGQELRVGLAKTQEEHSKGLSGVETLPVGTGLLFDMGGKTQPAFWMKEMRIPIDIIWISDNVVTQVHKNLPVPSPGTPERQLPLYIPSQRINFVLEVPAGYSDSANIKAGSPVDLSGLP